MNNCQFNPEQINLSAGTPIECPNCGHFIFAGLPHPDFSSQELPITEEELVRLAQEGLVS